MLSKKELIDLVLASFEAERTGSIVKKRAYLHDDFAVIDMIVEVDGELLPKVDGKQLHDLIDKAFVIKGRKFSLPSIVADEDTQTVMVEFIESYPDPRTGKVYRTPQVAVCKMKNGKLYRTRHYMDPRLSRENLTQEQIDKALE